ncbi:ABC transporter ATP-binding protein [Pseudonocardia nigra]|uniref:ABC transporter ATP-binding protein n=1 Tax=Pseudonocardia nigra TaxID=1921578 RepID=UPI001C600372|nr:ABC transporter ATP-binding protein [Pseudonocardia nigra]
MSGPEVMGPVLSIRDLTVEFTTPTGTVHAVTEVSLDVHPGEVVGVVGESGCGKTATLLGGMRLLPEPPARIVGGEVLLHGRDLLRMSRRELRRVRGREVGVVFQDPLTSLHPSMRVGEQIAEALRVHDRHRSASSARARAVELLELVGVPAAAARFRDYPHQWSGGMRQRAMIAAAIANRPAVLIADEPTTALDVTIQAQVLDVLRLARAETGAAIVLVSHDLGVIAEMADRVVVMYAGRVVETGSVESVFAAPRHPYTAALLASVPRLDGPVVLTDPIPGQPPALRVLPSGCGFAERCPCRHERCCTEAPPARSGTVHQVACHFPLRSGDT